MCSLNNIILLSQLLSESSIEFQEIFSIWIEPILVTINLNGPNKKMLYSTRMNNFWSDGKAKKQSKLEKSILAGSINDKIDMHNLIYKNYQASKYSNISVFNQSLLLVL